jgi:hypothetical protein
MRDVPSSPPTPPVIETCIEMNDNIKISQKDQSANEIAPLYQDAMDIQNTFHAMLRKHAELTGTKATCPEMKKLYRYEECTCCLCVLCTRNHLRHHPD